MLVLLDEAEVVIVDAALAIDEDDVYTLAVDVNAASEVDGASNER